MTINRPARLRGILTYLFSSLKREGYMVCFSEYVNIICVFRVPRYMHVFIAETMYVHI